jgi:hypothetical protein
MGDQMPPMKPWPVRVYWWVRSYVTWPADVRRLKAMGARRIGFMHWELAPVPKVSLDDLQALLDEYAQTRGHSRLLCAPDVADELFHDPAPRPQGDFMPPGPGLAPSMLMAVDIVRKAEMPPGLWNLVHNEVTVREGTLA